jgi:hypothetical protein
MSPVAISAGTTATTSVKPLVLAALALLLLALNTVVVSSPQLQILSVSPMATHVAATAASQINIISTAEAMYVFPRASLAETALNATVFDADDDAAAALQPGRNSITVVIWFNLQVQVFSGTRLLHDSARANGEATQFTRYERGLSANVLSKGWCDKSVSHSSYLLSNERGGNTTSSRCDDVIACARAYVRPYVARNESVPSLHAWMSKTPWRSAAPFDPANR